MHQPPHRPHLQHPGHGRPFPLHPKPIYLGLIALYLGLALLLRSPGALFAFPSAVLLLDTIVIRREERFLTRHFGDTYLTYRTGTRRWL